MTQVGEGPRAVKAAAPEPSDTASGGPFAGEVLAERYRLEQHINNDSAGRQVWRGVDVVLRRPVAMVLRQPGGESAQEMLSAAVTASRVVHPNLIGVYDAIDETRYAYVVREWIDGFALRELVESEGPFDVERTVSTLNLVCDAVAALQASGMAHGNVHPGSILVAVDGRVVLADAKLDAHTSYEADVRALGGLGYFMLTGQWPRAEAGRSTLPDAHRDGSGRPVAPSSVRAGVPEYLDDLVMGLLDPEQTPPDAQVLSAELDRLDTSSQLLFDGVDTLRFVEPADERPVLGNSTGPRLMVAGAIAVALVVAGVVFGVKSLTGGTGVAPEQTPSSSTTAAAPTSKPDPVTRALPLRAEQVRVVDPDGARDELDGAAYMVDGDADTFWKTDGYQGAANFGNIKSGMGVLIKLDQPELVASVKVQLTAPGATAVLRTGSKDFGDSSTGDKQINKTFQNIGEPLEQSGVTMVFNTDLETSHQYLLIWFTELPLGEDGKYRIGVQEITVEVQ